MSVKNPMTPSRIEPATFQLVAQGVNQLRHRVPSKEYEYHHEISVRTTVTQSKFEPGICRYLWTCVRNVMDEVV
jgi:hypothetical protein